MNWDFRTVEYFLKVAETLSFSQAGRELYISTQAVNKQILQLEKQLGAELFTRSTRRISLTDAGKLLYGNFKPVSDAYEQAKQRTLQQLAPTRLPLRIAFFQALPKAQVVTQVVSYLLSRQPTLDIKMDAARLDDTISWLMDGKIDLCITNKHDFDVWDGVEFITLARMPAQIVVSLNHPWVMKKAITAEDMANAPVLLLEKNIELPANSFYKNIKAAAVQYASDFTTMLAELDLAQHYAVFPKLFENADYYKLRFFDLPEPFSFMYEMVCVFKIENSFAPLLYDMKEYFEAMPLELKR